MTTFTIEEIQDALDRPHGKRALHPTLRDRELSIVNHGDFIHPHPSYLHHGVGGFAVVYRVRDAKTGTEAAFRCWKRSDLPPGTQARCEALERFQSAQPSPSPYLVRQRFFPEALWVQGTYQPAILMEWLNGQNLRDAVEKACADLAAGLSSGRPPLPDSNPVLALAVAFEAMVYDLQSQNAGHGDLQQDNILVRPDGSLCLVDYDSFFVPGMVENEPCPVSGVEGYGHPEYISGGAVRPSNAHLDTFSAVIIALSLRILAAAPERFGTNSRQNLLFTGDDIDDPEGSAFVRALQAEFTQEPVTSLLTALITLRRDREKAQVAFAQVAGGKRSRAASAARFIAPALPPLSVPQTWQRFAVTC